MSRTAAASARPSASPSSRPTTVASASGSSPRSTQARTTYGWPCDHCGICDFRHVCWQQRVDDDHLILVAGLRRGAGRDARRSRHRHARGARRPRARHVRRRAPCRDARGDPPPGLAAAAGPARARYLFDLLPDEEDRGFRLLPEPDEGDVWFDMEGHPFYETARGLEYLFGYCYRDDAGRGRLRRGVGTGPRRRAGGVRALRRLGRRAPAASSRPARLPLRLLRALRADAADGRARHPRAGGGRLPAPGGARRPLPRRQAGAARVRRQLLDQGDREALRLRAHRRGVGRRRVRRPLRGMGRERRRHACSRTSSATTRRTAARPTSCTGGCSGYGRTERRGALRPRAASRPTRPPPPSTSAKR